jgi:vesicle transport through interaction with t-SNAREs protein 1
MAKGQIAQMEVELPSMPVSIRQNYQTRLSTSKQSLEKVKKTIVRQICDTDQSPH